jgi:ATP-binding cassette subfamily C protein CydC
MIRTIRQIRPVADLFLAGNRAMLLIGVLLTVATALSGVALLGLSGWFIAATGIAGLSVATALAFDVFAPSAGIRFLALTRTASRYGERLATHHATLGVLAELRERLFRAWSRPDAARELAGRPARLLFRLTLDIDALDLLYLRVALPVLGALSVALATGVVFGMIDPFLGLGAFALLVTVGLGIPTLAAIAARRPARRRAHALETLRVRVIDLVSGQTEWIMAGRLAAQREEIAAVDQYLTRIETRAGMGFGIAGAVLLSGVLVAVAFLAHSGAAGAPAAALGVLVALSVLEPFVPLRRGAVELGRTLLSARRIAPRLAPPPTTATVLAPMDGSAVRVEGVSVRHPGAAGFALRDVDFSVGRCERIAVIGASGAGKSTLLALLAGEIEAESGRVARCEATLVTQRSELFQDTVRDNLRLADPHADDDRLLDALEAAGLRVDIEALPAGLDTRLGEGGHGLSGGQARRLALARLFLRDTPLWLLDEPTEGLDRATARDVMRRLVAHSGARAVVTATHIRREAEAADRLVVMKQASIAAIVGRGESGYEAALAALRPD